MFVVNYPFACNDRYKAQSFHHLFFKIWAPFQTLQE